MGEKELPNEVQTRKRRIAEIAREVLKIKTLKEALRRAYHAGRCDA